MPKQTPLLAIGSAILRRLEGEAFELSNAGQIDAIENHLELAGREFESQRVRRRLGEVIATGFEPLAPPTQTVPAPVQDLESIRRSIAKDEQVTAEGIGLQPRPNAGK
jgi:hypothetical protein